MTASETLATLANRMRGLSPDALVEAVRATLAPIVRDGPDAARRTLDAEGRAALAQVCVVAADAALDPTVGDEDLAARLLRLALLLGGLDANGRVVLGRLWALSDPPPSDPLAVCVYRELVRASARNPALIDAATRVVKLELV